MLNIIILATSIIAISCDKIKSTIKFTNSQFTRMNILVYIHLECIDALSHVPTRSTFYNAS